MDVLHAGLRCQHLLPVGQLLLGELGPDDQLLLARTRLSAEYRKCPPPPSPTALGSQPGKTIAFCCPTSKFFLFSHLAPRAGNNSHYRLRVPRCNPRKHLLGLREKDVDIDLGRCLR